MRRVRALGSGPGAGGRSARASIAGALRVRRRRPRAGAARLGPGGRGPAPTTVRPALDLRAGSRAPRSAAAGVDDLTDVDVCTSASADHFSYRRDGADRAPGVDRGARAVSAVAGERSPRCGRGSPPPRGRAGREPDAVRARRRDEDRARRAGRRGPRRRRHRPRREPRPGAPGQGGHAGGDGAFDAPTSLALPRAAAAEQGAQRSRRGSTWWQSVDREALGAAIARHAPGARVLVEVNLGGRAAEGRLRAGSTPAALADALRELGLRVEGLMTVPPAGRRSPPVVRRAPGPCGGDLECGPSCPWA